MIRCIAFFVALLWVVVLPAQPKSCCETECATPTAAFASLGMEVDFRTTHANPTGFILEDPRGTAVKFLTPDGQTANGYYIPAETPSPNYLLVIHEWWGLNDYVRNESDRLHAALGNVNVLALDLYDGKVATERAQAAEYMRGASEERIRAIVRGALNNVGPQAKVQTIGWCFGGGWSHQTAIMAGTQASGCVIYYGMPESDPEKLGALQAPVLGIFAGQDKWINGEVVAKFEGAMREAGKTVTTKTFDAAHAFANPSRDIYDETATREANQMALDFLKAHF
ncbi:MAG: dienelactone hydrolase family protein [Bacteroidota bacterium]